MFFLLGRLRAEPSSTPVSKAFVAVGISVVWSTGCEEVHRRSISSFWSRSMVRTRCATVAMPWPRKPPRSSLLRGPEARLGPMACYCDCAGAPRAHGRRREALQPPAAVAALAGVGGYHRWPVSVGKPNLEATLSLSLSMPSAENAIFFVQLLLFCSMPSG